MTTLVNVLLRHKAIKDAISSFVAEYGEEAVKKTEGYKMMVNEMAELEAEWGIEGREDRR